VIIVHDFPPNFAEIAEKFDVVGKPIIFAFGNRIFNPENIDVVPALIAHEKVHGERQGSDVRGWWRKYIADTEFRLAEEIPAHIAEYKIDVARVTDRNRRAVLAHRIAVRLASPLYGSLIKPTAALKLIREAA
jgi:hypothetical protein